MHACMAQNQSDAFHTSPDPDELGMCSEEDFRSTSLRNVMYEYEEHTRAVSNAREAIMSSMQEHYPTIEAAIGTAPSTPIAPGSCTILSRIRPNVNPWRDRQPSVYIERQQ
jgi:hypothetical protein